LNVSVVDDGGSGVIYVTLSSAPNKTIVVGDRISPYTDRADVIASAIETYFDTLGPGEIVPPADLRASRAVRQPLTTSRYPWRAGQAVVSTVADAVGAVASDVELSVITRTVPDQPGNISDGPNLITLGKVNIYPL
jgi:hypothetical protein